MILGALIGALLLLNVDLVTPLALADVILVAVCAASSLAAKRSPPRIG
jgi:hypothetical protein